MPLPRLQLGEFEDAVWLPLWLRRMVVEALGFTMQSLRVYEQFFAHWQRATHGTSRVIDLASGSAMHVESLLACRERQSRGGARLGDEGAPDIVLTDLAPNLERFAELERDHPGVVRGERTPVDATHAGTRFAGASGAHALSMFTAFHHLNDAEQRQLLTEATRTSDAIVIAEASERSLQCLLANLFGLFLGAAAAFAPSRFSWRRLFFSTVVPIVPLMLVWDGIASVLRCRTVTELEALVRSLPTNAFRWEIQRVRHPIWPLSLAPGVVLVGVRTPTNQAK